MNYSLPCLDGDVVTGLNSTQQMLFVGIYLICIPILIYCAVCIIRLLHGSNCIAQETADAIVDDCREMLRPQQRTHTNNI
jgi:hypothetical protein